MDLRIEALTDDIRRIAFTGELDRSDVPRVEQRVRSMLNGSRSAVLDLTDAPGSGWIGVRLAVAVAGADATQSRRVVLVNPDERMRRLLKTTGLDELVHVSPSVPEAVRSIERGA